MSRARILNHSRYFPDYDPSGFTPGKMPAGWKKPEPLYRVCVQDRVQGAIYVTPAMIKDAAQMFCDAVEKQIKAGFERNWTNPSVQLCHL